jgi:hypothetical protein
MGIFLEAGLQDPEQCFTLFRGQGLLGFNAFPKGIPFAVMSWKKPGGP